MPDIDHVVKRIRYEAQCARHARVDVRAEDLVALCDEIERLTRDLELAKQDWTA